MWGGGSCMWEGRAGTLAHHELSVAAKYLLRHRIKRSGSQHRSRIETAGSKKGRGEGGRNGPHSWCYLVNPSSKSQPVLNSGPDTYELWRWYAGRLPPRSVPATQS
jgi:hypothetical protein